MASAVLPKQVRWRQCSNCLGSHLTTGISGHEGGFVSLYLSCEPTEEEKERAVDGK